jgi:phosphoglycerol transferase
VAAAAVATAVIRRRPVALATGVLVIGLIVTATVVTAAPTLAYAIRHGSNDVVSKRGSNESEIFALKLTQLVLPIEDHRVGPLRRASASYAETAPFGELGRPVHLGLVGTVGFVWLLVVAVLRVLAPAGVQIGAAYRHLAGATLLALLLGTIGGVSALIAAVTPQLRAWNRLSIFIGFFALVAVGFALTGLGRRLTYGGGARLALWGGALAAMLVIGVLDQTSTRDARDYDALRAEYASDAAFVREIEKRLPRGAAVLQLPYVPFPEAGLPGKLGDYDHVRPYLHSNTLRWSFGAMKGRPDDWLAPRAGESMELLLPAAVEDGFAGVYVDRRGYEDGGKDVEAAVAKILGGKRPLVSANERFVFYDLRDVPGMRTGAG